MSVPRWFKSRRPTPAPVPPRISPEDRLVADHAGFTEAQFAALPALVKRDAREAFFWAHGLTA